jgi:hypothetical protein
LATFGDNLTLDALPGTDAFSTLWEMRQSADQWGMPYSVYLGLCFSLYRRQDPDNFRKPSLKFARRESTISWRRKRAKIWDDERDEALRSLANITPYRLEAYSGLPAPNWLRGHLLFLGASTGNWTEIVKHYVVKERCLPTSLLSGRLDAHTRQRLREVVRFELASGLLEINSFTGTEPHTLWQSCFGIPGAQDFTGPACPACPQSNSCRDMGLRLSALTRR